MEAREPCISRERSKVAKEVLRTFSTKGYANKKPTCQEQRQEYSHKNDKTKSHTNKAIRIEARATQGQVQDQDDATPLEEGKVVLVEE